MQPVFKGLLLAFLTAAFSLPLHAQSSQNDHDLAQMASSREWLSLLHVPRSETSSYVIDKSFFLAANGRVDPQAELLATIQAFAADNQLICRFPARYQFLNHQGVIAAQDLEPCGEYLKWRQKLNVQNVVLVLAASYLNSPSSMYGHSFLRFDPGGERARSPFLSYALNFGAQIPAGENGMLYAYRGIFGGYPGYFSLQPYYEKIQEYTRLENRDMWEYQLELNVAEIERLLSHSWELNGIRFGYYFFDENCAYRLLELLEVARPELDLTSGFEHAAMPVDTIRRVVNDGLVSSVNYRASRHSELEALSENLNHRDRQLVVKLAEGELQVDSAQLQTYSDELRQQLVMAAYRLLRYRHNREQRDTSSANRALALLRASNEMGRLEPPEPNRPSRPEQGHPTSLFALSIGVLEDRPFADIEWRISYHDAVDSAPGYPSGASLEMGQLRLRWLEGRNLELQQFVPVHIRSLSPRDEYAKPISWQVRGIAERLPGGENPLVTAVHGGAGGSWSLLGGTSFLMPTLRLEHNPEFQQDWQLAVGGQVGQVWQSANVSAEVSVNYIDFLDAGERWHYGFKVNQRLTSNQALRLSLDRVERRHEHFNEASLSWRYYF